MYGRSWDGTKSRNSRSITPVPGPTTNRRVIVRVRCAGQKKKKKKEEKKRGKIEFRVCCIFNMFLLFGATVPLAGEKRPTQQQKEKGESTAEGVCCWRTVTNVTSHELYTRLQIKNSCWAKHLKEIELPLPINNKSTGLCRTYARYRQVVVTVGEGKNPDVIKTHHLRPAIFILISQQ